MLGAGAGDWFGKKKQCKRKRRIGEKREERNINIIILKNIFKMRNQVRKFPGTHDKGWKINQPKRHVSNKQNISFKCKKCK